MCGFRRDPITKRCTYPKTTTDSRMNPGRPKKELRPWPPSRGNGPGHAHDCGHGIRRASTIANAGVILSMATATAWPMAKAVHAHGCRLGTWFWSWTWYQPCPWLWTWPRKAILWAPVELPPNKRPHLINNNRFT